MTSNVTPISDNLFGGPRIPAVRLSTAWGQIAHSALRMQRMSAAVALRQMCIDNGIIVVRFRFAVNTDQSVTLSDPVFNGGDVTLDATTTRGIIATAQVSHLYDRFVDNKNEDLVWGDKYLDPLFRGTILDDTENLVASLELDADLGPYVERLTTPSDLRAIGPGLDTIDELAADL